MPVQWPSQPPAFPTDLRTYSQPSQPHINLPYPAHEAVKLEAFGPSTSTSAPPMAPPPTNIANLLTTLLKAGVVSANGTPLGAGATSKEEEFKVPTTETVNLDRESSRAYRQAILSQNIQLTSSDIIKYVSSFQMRLKISPNFFSGNAR